MVEEESVEPPLSLERTPLQRFLYGLGALFYSSVFRAVWRRRVLNAELVPPSGGLLFAANHASFADPPLVGTSVGRPVYYMAKEELFRVPVFGWALRQVNAFPIKRKQGDVGAFRLAQRILKAGGALVVFPEGKRQKSGQLGPAKAGAALLAKKARVDVVPVYLHNNHRTLRLAPLTVVFGAPMRAGPGESAEAFSARIMDALRALKEKNFGSQP